jgi:hypothetical protein
MPVGRRPRWEVRRQSPCSAISADTMPLRFSNAGDRHAASDGLSPISSATETAPSVAFEIRRAVSIFGVARPSAMSWIVCQRRPVRSRSDRLMPTPCASTYSASVTLVVYGGP